MKKYHLKNGIYVFSDGAHNFGTDAVLLADFAAPKSRDRLVDLGTGCGIIPLILRARGHVGRSVGVDISEKAIELCECANASNGKNAAVEFINADLKALKGILPFGEFDVVTMNPPYKAANDGIVSDDKEKSGANHEVLCTFEDICNAAAKLLRFGGRFCICQRPARLCELMLCMKNARIEPKKMRLVQQRKSADASLVLLEGRFGANSGMTVLKTLFIENDEGGQSAEMDEILKKSYQAQEG